MPKYNVMDSDGNWLGCVYAETEEEAVRAAKAQGMTGAASAEEKPEHERGRP